MKNKPADMPYCGVDLDNITRANPVFQKGRLGLFAKYFMERYRIHIRKDVDKVDAPWTTWDTLQEYKFTNVRREQDRHSLMLINTICKADISWRHKVANIFLFRALNNGYTMDLIGAPFTTSGDKLVDKVRSIVDEHSKHHKDHVYYTDAFNTGGLKRSWSKSSGQPGVTSVPSDKEENMVVRMVNLYNHVYDSDYAKQLDACKFQDDAFEVIKTLIGFGPFLSYQVFVDLTYCDEFQFSENEFTVSGPGCSAGIDNLFDNKDGMTDEECIFYIRDNQDTLFRAFYYRRDLWLDLPISDRSLNVMSIENIFCEFSKLCRIVDGGWTTRRYKGTSNG